MATLDRETLEAALIGFEQQKEQIESKIAQLRAHLGGHMAEAPVKKRGRWKFSTETRLKMAAAQQRRWAGKTDTVAAPEVKVAKQARKPRAPLSAEARESIAAAQRKRWAKAKKAAKKSA
jgi:hypothetical protein